jgi:hypothetical protein
LGQPVDQVTNPHCPVAEVTEVTNHNHNGFSASTCKEFVQNSFEETLVLHSAALKLQYYIYIFADSIVYSDSTV